MKQLIVTLGLAIILTNSTHCFAVTWPGLCLKMFYDINANCIKDSTESYSLVPVLLRVDSNGVTVDTLSATSVVFYVPNAPVGTIYKFTVLPYPGGPTISCPSSGFVLDTILSTYSYHDKYFAMTCPTTPVFDLGEHCISHLAGTMDQQALIYAGNNSCATAAGTLTVNFGPKYMYAGGPGRTPTSVSGRTLTWNIPGGPSEAIYVELLHDAGAGMLTVGDTAQMHITITPTAGDIDTSNNSETITDTIKASHDPNEITVSPAGCIASGMSPVVLTYDLRFSNTGTDTAQNIYVLDTLSEFLDPHTLRIVAATDTMNITVQNILDMYSGIYHGIVKFEFPNIKLPDSSHHGLCDGGVIYTVKTRPGLTAGMHIYNHAGIYFDSNPAVLTNWADNGIGCATTGVVMPAAKTTDIYPNPATTELTVTAQDRITTIAISNVYGQTVYSNDYNAEKVGINIAALPAGIYFIRINGTEVKRFVKE